MHLSREGLILLTFCHGMIPDTTELHTQSSVGQQRESNGQSGKKNPLWFEVKVFNKGRKSCTWKKSKPRDSFPTSHWQVQPSPG